MAKEELREIDKRVAVALGTTVFWHKGLFGGLSGYKIRQIARPYAGLNQSIPPWVEDGLFGDEDYAWSKVWHYTTDPAAADLVRQEIERRGWGMAMWNSKGRWCVGVMPTDDGELEGITAKDFLGGKKNDSPHVALCLAFLAACEAQEKS